MSKLEGTIFNIQKFSITDGVGIRTLVFMKGCPLHCLWCSNPESQNGKPEIMDVRLNCVRCENCAAACPEKAIDPASFRIDRTICSACGICAEQCYTNAKKTVGQIYTIADLMDVIIRDRVFYKNSGGGVTVGGGEPLMQAEFVAAFLESCQAVHINTAVETCGYGPWEKVQLVFHHADQIFFDLKLMDSEKHRKFTGARNSLILDNAVRMGRLGKQVVFRVPLIHGINDDAENLEQIADFVREQMKYNDNISLELLPYHSYGRDKYRWLDRHYPLNDEGTVPDEVMEAAKSFMKNKSLNLI